MVLLAVLMAVRQYLLYFEPLLLPSVQGLPVVSRKPFWQSS